MPKPPQRPATPRQQREARDLFRALDRLEPDAPEFGHKLAELLAYEPALPALISEWFRSGDERRIERARVAQRLCAVPGDERAAAIAHLRHATLLDLRDEMESKREAGPLLVEVPIGPEGPVLAGLDERLLGRLGAKSVLKERGWTRAPSRADAVAWPRPVTVGDDLAVRLVLSPEVSAALVVRLVAPRADLPPELRQAIDAAPEGAPPGDPATWRPSGSTGEQIEQLVRQLRTLERQGYGRTALFSDRLAHYLRLVDKRRLERIGREIKAAAERSPLVVHATLDARGVMNAIRPPHILAGVVKAYGVGRQDIATLRGPVQPRAGRQALRLVLNHDVEVPLWIEVTAPPPDLPAFLLEDLRSVGGDDGPEPERAATLLDEPADPAGSADRLGERCRALFRAGYAYHERFKPHLAAYCQARSQELAGKRDAPSRALARKYRLAGLQVEDRPPAETALPDQAIRVLEQLLPMYVDPPAWAAGAVPARRPAGAPVEAFRGLGPLAAAAHAAYHESPLAVARALAGVAVSRPEWSLAFVDALDAGLGEGSLRDTLAPLLLIASLEEDKPAPVVPLLARLLGRSAAVERLAPEIEALLAALRSYLEHLLEIQEFYRLSDEYVRLQEQIAALASRLAAGPESEPAAQVLARALARLRDWAEERFRQDSLADPNLAAPGGVEGTAGAAGPAPVPMTPDGYMRARQLLVKYERGLAEAISLKTGGGITSGDTFHDNFSFEEGERQERMYRRLIRELKEKLRLATIIEPARGEGAPAVGLGATVRVRFEDGGEIETYTVLGEIEANPGLGIISEKSPLGAALLGAHAGDVVEFRVGAKAWRVQVMEIG